MTESLEAVFACAIAVMAVATIASVIHELIGESHD